MIYTVDNIDFNVEYEINMGYPATREDPGEPPHVDSLRVLYDGLDFTGVLSEAVLIDIERACMDDAARQRGRYYDEFEGH